MSSGRVLQPWQIFASFSYLDGRMHSQGTTNDERLTLTPEFSGSLWTTYRLPMRLTLGGGIRALGSVWVDAANTIRQPGYHVVDGFAEYPVNTHFSLRLNVRNLTDEVYILSVNNNGSRYNPGPPRSVLLTSVIGF